ncbi:MAG: ATP-binding cassette domain-containing protein [Pseudomonadales bacterium]
MLSVTSLTKQYGDFTAVDNVSFAASKGSVFGLLGPNGAGKSTAISCISGLLSPTSARISIDGAGIVRKAKRATRTLGIVSQELAI